MLNDSMLLATLIQFPLKKTRFLLKRWIHNVGRSRCNGIRQEVFSGLLVRKANMLAAGFVRAAVSEGYLGKVAVVFATDITIDTHSLTHLAFF